MGPGLNKDKTNVLLGLRGQGSDGSARWLAANKAGVHGRVATDMRILGPYLNVVVEHAGRSAEQDKGSKNCMEAGGKNLVREHREETEARVVHSDRAECLAQCDGMIHHPGKAGREDG